MEQTWQAEVAKTMLFCRFGSDSSEREGKDSETCDLTNDISIKRFSYSVNNAMKLDTLFSNCYLMPLAYFYTVDLRSHKISR